LINIIFGHFTGSLLTTLAIIISDDYFILSFFGMNEAKKYRNVEIPAIIKNPFLGG